MRAATNHQSVRDYTIEEVAPGALFNTATNAPLKLADTCVKLNRRVGADPEAKRKAVAAFMKERFKL